MNRLMLSLLLTIALGGLLGSGRASTAVSKPAEAAQAATELWLPLVDNEKYAESWEKMAASFKKDVSKAKWISAVTEIRQPLGKLTSRKLKTAEFTRDLPGAPEGEYVVLKYETVFEKKPISEETVIAVITQDLVWYVTGYSVK